MEYKRTEVSVFLALCGTNFDEPQGRFGTASRLGVEEQAISVNVDFVVSSHRCRPSSSGVKIVLS